MSPLSTLLFRKVPPVLRTVVQPHLDEIQKADIFTAVDGLLTALAAQKEMDVITFVESGEATNSILELTGIQPKESDIGVVVCPKCKFTQYSVKGK